MSSLTDRTSAARRRTPLNRSQIAGFGRLGRLDARRHGLVHLRARAHAGADRAIAALRLRGDARQHRTGRFYSVCAVPGRLGHVLHMGTARRSLWTNQGAGGHDLHIRDFHGPCRDFSQRVGVGHLSLHRGSRHRRGMGARRHLRGGSVAGGSSQDGRGLSANGVLRGLLPGRGAELHNWRALRLACNVPDGSRAGRRRDSDFVAREGIREMAEGRGARRTRETAARDPGTGLPAAHMGRVHSLDHCHYRFVGGGRI